MNLQLYSTDDLITEILNRHDHAIFMGIKVLSEDKEYLGNIVSVRRWVGNTYTCCGLADSIKKTILDEFMDKENPIEKEDL